MTTEEMVPVDRVHVKIHDDNGLARRTVMFGIPGAVGIVVELEASEEGLKPVFVVNVEAGGLPGIEGKQERLEYVGNVLRVVADSLTDYVDEEVSAV